MDTGIISDLERAWQWASETLDYVLEMNSMRIADEPGSSSDNNMPLHSHSLATPLYSLSTMTANQQAAASPANFVSSASSPGSPSSPAVAEFRRHSRNLVPSPAVPVQEPVTTLSPVPNSTGPPQPGGGPLSRTHVVPPRPKPGRKPATEEPESKRKAQNRASQRSFRQRKQRTVEELQKSVNLKTELLEKESAARSREAHEFTKRIELLEAQVHMLENELMLWKSGRYSAQPSMGPMTGQHPSMPFYQPRHDTPLRRAFDTDFDAQALVPSPQPTESGCDRCTKDHCACLAEMTNDVTFDGHGEAMTGILHDGQGDSDEEKSRDHSEFETDFTSAFRKAKPHDANPAELLSSAEDSKLPDCGFCTDQPESCICKSMRSDAGDATSSLARIATASSAEDVKPNMAMTGPGSCADCQANPEQRAWCQRVAQLRSEATPPNSRRNSSKSIVLGTMEPKASTSIDMSNSTPYPAGRGETVGCSDAFKLLVGRVDTEMDWRKLKPVPSTFAQDSARRNTFTMEPGMYSAMELDASSILTTLQHAPGPIKPRPSDGTYARLVQEAEERRRKSSTPMKKTDDHPMLDSVKN